MFEHWLNMGSGYCCQRSFLRFTGDARTSFVNSMVSNDVNSLSIGQGLHAAFLDLQGKVLADARIFCATNSLLVDIPECRKESMLQYLKRHPTADDVEIRDLSGEYSMLSVQGPNADWLIADAVLSDGLPLVDLVYRQVTIAATTDTDRGICRMLCRALRKWGSTGLFRGWGWKPKRCSESRRVFPSTD